MRRRIRDLGIGQLAAAARYGRAARQRVRGGASRPRSARDAHPRPRPGDIRDGAAAPGDGRAGLALVPPLPPRCLRRLRPALGPARGRSLRPRGPQVRGDGRRRPAHQLPAGRPRAGNDLSGCGTSRTSRSVPIPTSAIWPARAGASTSRSTPPPTRSSPWRGGRRAPRSSGAAAASLPSTSPRWPRRSPIRSPGAKRPPLDERLFGREPEPLPPTRGATSRAGPSSRCRSRS